MDKTWGMNVQKFNRKTPYKWLFINQLKQTVETQWINFGPPWSDASLNRDNDSVFACNNWTSICLVLKVLVLGCIIVFVVVIIVVVVVAVLVVVVPVPVVQEPCWDC